MSNKDWKNSKVRHIPVENREVTDSDYMIAYSFVMSYGWRMVNTGVDDEGNRVTKWVCPKGSTVDTVFDARDVQHLRLMQESV